MVIRLENFGFIIYLLITNQQMPLIPSHPRKHQLQKTSAKLLLHLEPIISNAKAEIFIKDVPALFK